MIQAKNVFANKPRLMMMVLTVVVPGVAMLVISRICVISRFIV